MFVEKSTQRSWNSRLKCLFNSIPLIAVIQIMQDKGSLKTDSLTVCVGGGGRNQLKWLSDTYHRMKSTNPEAVRDQIQN